MRENYTPDEVRAWTAEDLKKLVGKFVVVTAPAGEWAKEMFNSEWEGGAGICTKAGIRTELGHEKLGEAVIRFVEWDSMFGFHWTVDAKASVGVCDEHGEHNVRAIPPHKNHPHRATAEVDPGAEECLVTLGVQKVSEEGDEGDGAGN